MRLVGDYFYILFYLKFFTSLYPFRMQVNQWATLWRFSCAPSTAQYTVPMQYVALCHRDRCQPPWRASSPSKMAIQCHCPPW